MPKPAAVINEAFFAERTAACTIPDVAIPVILRRGAAGESQQAIADDYGVPQAHISRILLGQSRRVA